ncbi:MAG: DUF4301 family protein [Bacteroidota bacterium]|nr:DUF4301 family protein [Bacteroidota bacterium]
MLTPNDLQQICRHGLTSEIVDRQLRNFSKGFPFLRLKKAAGIRDGITCLEKQDIEKMCLFYDQSIKEGLIPLKFVPASGAATRMFQVLYNFRQDYKDEGQALELLQEPRYAQVKLFFNSLHCFAFYEDLALALAKDGKGIEGATKSEIIDYLLTEKGLNYGNKPKGLLKFHRYGLLSKTPIEEHLEEACSYACPADGIIRIHLTVSPQHKVDFEAKIESVRQAFELKYDVKLDINFSEQKSSTDTVAVNTDNSFFRNTDGSLLFRPAGHGALIENLNELDADLIFIKNIDNVTIDSLRGETIRYKKALAGLLLQIRERIYHYQQILDIRNLFQIDDVLIAEVVEFLKNTLHIIPSLNLNSIEKEELIPYLKTKLDRPLRVCGMVKNEGDPGGGPFWTYNPDGTISLQIAESSQIDMNDPQQALIAKNASHFNPVDLVCSIKDYRGKKYDLTQYVNPETGFISQKSQSGKVIKVQELPGLWNGAMAEWNTIFVEVPGITFTPVKTVFDLLKDEHLTNKKTIELIQ